MRRRSFRLRPAPVSAPVSRGSFAGVTARRVLLHLALAPLALALGCERPETAPPVRAEFGVFYGGQVQDREEIPLDLDRTRQMHGIRLEWAEPTKKPARVAWEIQKPGTGKDADAGGLVEYGEVKTRTGEQSLSLPLSFRPGDPLGTWRVKVKVDDKVVLERSVRVVRPGPGPLPPEQ